MTSDDIDTIVGMTNPLRELVAAERRRHGWSIRRAAEHGGISNTHWGRFEKGGDITAGVRVAVARAFNWPTDWDEHPPAARPWRPPDGRCVFRSRYSLCRNNDRSDVATGKTRTRDRMLDSPNRAHPIPSWT